ncbi:MAG TPA: DUF1289 domain-containing protein [Candidatus Cybelea sp.]|nr:DUF1289 domain-containing protein [Candidatus Cybelea sp.]
MAATKGRMSEASQDDAADAGFEVPSPCIGVCILDGDTGWCRGCLRTVPEIASWPRLSRAERRRLVERLAERRAENPA